MLRLGQQRRRFRPGAAASQGLPRGRPVHFIGRTSKAWSSRVAISPHLLSGSVGHQPVREQRAFGGPVAQRRPRLLVVDDEAGIRDLLVKALSVGRYDVEAAHGGPNALARIHQEAFDLLTTDLRMPEMDGLQLIRQARSVHSSLATIIITGFSTEESAAEAAMLGVAAFLIKPFRISQVLETVAQALDVSVP